jgi:hypothetical protein
MIHEFLLIKGVEAVASHGSKDQEEREWAIDSFKAGKKVGGGAWAAGRAFFLGGVLCTLAAAASGTDEVHAAVIVHATPMTMPNAIPCPADVIPCAACARCTCLAKCHCHTPTLTSCPPMLCCAVLCMLCRTCSLPRTLPPRVLISRASST